MKTEIVSNIFSDHNTLRLENNYRKRSNYQKKHTHTHTHTSTWRINNVLLNNQVITSEVKE